MKQLPILFSTEMVQAITENRKTMTRRTFGLEKVNESPDDWQFDTKIKPLFSFKHVKFGYITTSKPHYSIGDKLWVKETWRQNQFTDSIIMYKADTAYPEKFKWKSSLFMRKEYTRIWLEVTNVRCEQLRDITEADALAEGVDRWTEPNINWFRYKDYTENINWYLQAKQSFFSLWSKINGHESTIKNPWLFVYEFKRIDKP